MNHKGNLNIGKSDNYATKLKQMSEKEREEHLAARRERKLMRMEELSRKQAFEEVLNAQKAQWIAEANNMLVAQVKEAKLGNTQAFNAAMAYIIGKPETQLDITSNGNTLQAPTIIFKTRELDEWRDDQDEG